MPAARLSSCWRRPAVGRLSRRWPLSRRPAIACALLSSMRCAAPATRGPTSGMFSVSRGNPPGSATAPKSSCRPEGRKGAGGPFARRPAASLRLVALQPASSLHEKSRHRRQPMPASHGCCGCFSCEERLTGTLTRCGDNAGYVLELLYAGHARPGVRNHRGARLFSACRCSNVGARGHYGCQQALGASLARSCGRRNLVR